MQPTHKTIRSAGADVGAARETSINPAAVVIVPTGVCVPKNTPDDVFFGVALRSSLAVRGLMLANGIGIVDGDYPSEIGVMLYNTGTHIVTIRAGERIAQLIPMRFLPGIFPVEDKTRLGGFGSTN